ncbi:MAG: ribosome-associated translation inhibitor RaiA, partial [Verrucomicrobiota bacterium]
ASAVYTRTMPNNPVDNEPKITMQGVHVELTDALKKAIQEKFSVLLRHNSRIIRIDVRLHLDQQRGQQHNFSATGHIVISGPDLVATAKGDDAYNALDALVEKLDELVRERHERRKDKRNHPHDVELESNLPKVGAE